MVVIVLESVPITLRGELSRWLIEPTSGVFVGHVSALVREKLWMKVCSKVAGGGALLIWSTNNEQHFKMKLYGRTKRQIVDFDGLQLVCIPNKVSGMGTSSKR